MQASAGRRLSGEPCGYRHADLGRALGPPAARARLRANDADFQVDEILGFAPEGRGEHAWLRIRKQGLNTADLAARVARIAGVAGRDIGYSGMKDRHAVTTQWFSVGLAGRAEPDWTQLDDPSVTVEEVLRHTRKLRRGTHRGNRFRIVLRDLDGAPDELAARLQELRRRGLPNYFGEQRFGRDAGNLEWARRLFSGEVRVRDRRRRGLYLSAARALLFNRVLSARVAARTWDTPIPGDVMMLAGSHSVFVPAPDDVEISARCAGLDIHPTGVLWGRGEPLSRDRARELETQVLADCGLLRDGLERAGLKQERRSLRCVPADLAWEFSPADSLMLDFTLPRGAFATALIHELVEIG